VEVSHVIADLDGFNWIKLALYFSDQEFLVHPHEKIDLFRAVSDLEAKACWEHFDTLRQFRILCDLIQLGTDTGFESVAFATFN
jgi:hypothetical protein